MWIHELSSHWSKDLILSILDEAEFTSIEDNAYLSATMSNKVHLLITELLENEFLYIENWISNLVKLSIPAYIHLQSFIYRKDKVIIYS